MDNMLAKLDFAMAYLDGIIIKRETSELHRLHVKEVFLKIANFGSKLSMDKCEFYMSKIKFLG